MMKYRLVPAAVWLSLQALGAHAQEPVLLPAAGLHLVPSAGAAAPVERGSRADFGYDPSSAYDQKGTNAPRGFSAQVPGELIDPFSGNVVLHQPDFSLPGIAGLDLNLTRVYNSKIHRNYAARISGDPLRVSLGMLFIPPSPLGLGWSLHMGRLIGAVSTGPNSSLARPRYYERPDGSQHPFFQYTGAGCGDETGDVCLLTKARDNPFHSDPNQPWKLSTTDGRILTFAHRTFDGFDLVDYVTSIRDIHGNQIQIAYHDNTITIAGTTYEYEYLQHFIDFIVDSAGRRVDFGYSEVNPGVIRLTSITANGRVYRYTYSSVNPWPAAQAFLTVAQPPEDAPWRYRYRGLDPNDNTCADNSKRWCELTGITYPAGGTIDYAFADEVFWAHTNPMSARAIATRTAGGREVTPGTWTYEYNRGAQYAGADHTIITRPNGSQEISTFFGVGSGPYNPFGLAWKAGSLLRKRIVDAEGTELESESFEWAPSPRMSTESWGDPWIGFDNGVFVPHMTQRTLTRGSLSWTTTHTSFNDFNDTPRCTTERSSDGTERYRLNTFFIAQDLTQGFRFWKLPEVRTLSYAPFTPANCDEHQTSTVPLQLDSELDLSTYNSLGQLVRHQFNGIDTEMRFLGDGSLQATIDYRRREPGGALSDGFCTVHADYRYGVAQRTEQGAPAPACNAPLVTLRRTVDWFGSMSSQTSGGGSTTGFDYDGLGRIERIRPSGELPIDILYPLSSGFSASRRVERGSFFTETRWDGFGRKLHTSDSTGAHARQLYDGMGRLVFQGFPSFDPASSDGDSLSYDSLGRPRLVEHPDNTSMRLAYGLGAHTVTLTDENGRNTVQTRRGFSGPEDFWLVRVQLPGEAPPQQDQYFYTPGGHLLRSLANGKERVLERNFAKQVVAEHSSESGSIYYGYDAAGTLRCRDRQSPILCNGGNLDDDQAETRYAVDGLGRMTQVLYSDPDMTDASIAWDADSNLVARSDSAGTHLYTYDPDSRLSEAHSTILGVDYRTAYTYDSLGFLETLTYPSGRVLTYEREAGNRIDKIRDAQRVYVSALEYHPNGSPQRIVHGNGIATTLDLDLRQRPQRLRAPGVLDLEYELDGAGNLMELTDRVRPLGSTSFEYDLLDRLTRASGPWGSMAYTYNAAGDRLGMTSSGSSVTYAYDPSGRVRSLSAPSNPNFLSFLYDGFGNIHQRVDSGFNAFRYTFDQENRLTDITRVPSGGSPSSVVQYVYEAGGQRRILKRQGCGATRIEHRDAGGTLIAESTESGRMLREFVVADGRTIAELSVAELAANPGALQFGQVPLGSSQTLPVTLQNRSSASLRVLEIDAPYPFTVSAVLPLTIPAGQSRQLPVTFSPGDGGLYEQNLGFCTDGGVRQSVALQGQGGEALASLDSTYLQMGDVPFGSSVTRTVLLRNDGSSPLHVEGWSSSHPALSMEPSGGLTVAPGAEIELTLVLDTSLGCGGVFQGQMDLQSNNSSQVTLYVQATTVAFEALQPSVSLGPLAAGQSRTVEVQFANRAGVALLPRISLSGSPAFRLDSPQPSVLAPGATARATVTYTAPVKLWSPFGDHATLSAVRDGCLADCGAAVHFVGNVATQVVPGGSSSPELVFAGDTAYVSSIELRYSGQPGSFFDFFLKLAERRPDGTWFQMATPVTGELYDRAPNRAIVGRPDGLLTLLWQERAEAASISQRVPGETWTQPCPMQSGRPPMLVQLPSAPPTFMISFLDTGVLLIDSIDTTHGKCQTSSPSTRIQFDDEGPWRSPSLVAGQDGRVHFVGAEGNEIVMGTRVPDVLPFLEERVTVPAPGPGPVRVLRVDPQGRWHVLYIPAAEAGPLLYLRRDPGGAASAPEELFPPGAAISNLNLAIDSLGGLHAAWAASRCEQSRLYYAMKPAGAGAWQVTDVTTPGYALRGDLSMDLHGDRLAAAWYGYPGPLQEHLLAGEAEVGARNPPPPPVPTPIPPDLLWEGTLQGGDLRQKLLEVGPQIAAIELVASSGATRAACSVELRLRRPDGVTLGPWILSAAPLQIPQEAGPGTWTLLLGAKGDCNAQPFRIEARLVRQVGLAAGLALLGAGLLFARRAITSTTRHGRRPLR